MDQTSPIGQTPITVDSPSTPSRLPLTLLILVLMGVSAAGGFYLNRLVTPTIPTPKETTTTPAQPASTEPSTTTSTDVTASWKNYTNRKVGFQFRFPERYSQLELPTSVFEPISYANGNEDNEVLQTNNTQYDPKDNKSKYEPILLNFFPFKGGLQELVNSENTLTTSYPVKTLIRKFVVDERDARWYTVRAEKPIPDDPGGRIVVYFTGKNHGFVFSFEADHEEESMKILSTFRFD